MRVNDPIRSPAPKGSVSLYADDQCSPVDGGRGQSKCDNDPPPADPPPAVPPPTDPPPPARDVLHFSKDQLEERDKKIRDDAKKALFTDLGVTDEPELKSILTTHRSQDPDETRKLFNERINTVMKDLESERKIHTDTKLTLEVAKAAHVTRFEDPDYAEFLYKKHIATLNDAELAKVSPKSFLDGMRSKEEHKKLFFADKVAIDTRPPGTTPPPKDEDPPPVDVSKMSREEFARYRQDKGYSH